MSCTDRYPLPDAPMTNQIQQFANNRLGAVYSALYSFWTSRHAATTTNRQAIGSRRDAYSLILFNEGATQVLNNDFTSSPEELLAVVLRYQTNSGTNFSKALRTGQAVMEQNWSTERFITLYFVFLTPHLIFFPLRAPVMIFLSDGECSVSDSSTQDLCRTAVRLGCVTFSQC
jgi:hypothetical protein